MLARLRPLARHSIDVDLCWQTGDLEQTEDAFPKAADLDLRDYFRFALTPGRRLIQGGVASRISVVAYIGATEFARFHVDLVAGIQMTGAPDDVSPLVPVEVPGVLRCEHLAYPVADHIADKVCAIFAHTQRITADSMRRALDAEVDRRTLVLQTQLETPMGPGWRGICSGLSRCADAGERDLNSAMNTVSGFIEPILGGRAAGVWNPDALEWIVVTGEGERQS